MIITSLVSWYLPNLITMNGEQMPQDFFASIVFLLLGFFMIIIFFGISDKFVVVKLGGQSLIVKKGTWEKSINWLDVESLSLIQFVYPPLYRIKIRGIDKTLWFNTENQFISAGGFTSDLSEMGHLIKKKKSELGI
jgi:hypothetical protein